MKARLLAAFAAVTMLGAIAAQQPTDASASKLDQVRNLHRELDKVKDEVTKAMAELTPKLRAAERGSDEQKKLAAEAAELRGRQSGPDKAFREAFAAADFKAFDVTKDAALLKDGLPGLARDIEHPAKAIAACNLYLEHFGSERLADNIRGNALPNALLAIGQHAEATTALRAQLEKAEGGAKARVLLTLGDIEAAKGDLDAANKLYGEADAVADQNTKRYVTVRTAVIGKTAPNIDSKNWIGGTAKSLADLKGKVVLVDFWATWCGPCRAVMPSLNALYKEHNKSGLEVMGLTRFYANGYMAANPEQMQSGGTSVNGMTEETFPEHVTTFRTNTGIAYPFVIGAKEDFDHYNVTGIPTLAVIGKDGNVALMLVGSGSEGLLKFAIQRQLGAK